VVELIARRRPGRHLVDPRAYEVVHQELLDACQAAAGALPRLQEYEELAELVRPWMTLQVLKDTDREILYDLLLRCQEAERRLFGRAWAGGLGRGAAWVLAVLALVVLGSGAGNWLSPLGERLGQRWTGVDVLNRWAGEPHAWIAASFALAGVFIYLVSRAVRT
jgi:hypothetical protein